MRAADLGRRSFDLAALSSLAWGALFGLAYAQAPLYTSNQNQYFLHGLAQAGRGNLGQDWLANTADPTPLFTGLVRLTAGLLDERLFYLYFLLLAAVYLHSLWGIADRLFGLSSSRGRSVLFLATFFALHSAGLRIALGRFAGGGWEYLFDGGVAGQRMLGTVLQPSTFGVLLLLAVDQFLRGRPYRSAAAAAAAALLHPTYLLGAAVLVSSMVWLLYRRERNLRLPLRVGGLALALVLPALIYNARTFLPASPAALQILAQVRVPEHAVVAEWIEPAAAVKLAMILLAIYLVRGSPLSGILAVGTGAALLLTAVQLLTGSHSLSLLFPWRITTYLVPLASSVLAGWGARTAADWLARGHRSLQPAGLGTGWADPNVPRGARALGLAAMALSVVSGLAWSALQFAQQQADPARRVLAFVELQREPGQVYLIPPRLQDFRLVTGAPAMVDFKSIPYRGDQVLEWYDRLRLADLVYRDRIEQVNCERLGDAAREYGVTHLVLDDDLLGLDCPGLRWLYVDSSYAVASLELKRP
jgi:hypothetical protein